MVKLVKALLLACILASCAASSSNRQKSMPPENKSAKFAENLAGTTWEGIGIQTGGARWNILTNFGSESARTLYYDGECVARWTLIEQSENSATYREKIVNDSKCIDTIVTVFAEGSGRLGYRVSLTLGGRVIATSSLEPASKFTRKAAESDLVSESQDAKRDCGRRPVPPSIPSRPSGLNCAASAVATRMNNCTISGVSELACGELLEGPDTRLTTGAMNGAICSAAVSAAQGNAPKSSDLAVSAAIGAADNAGESTGGLLGGAIRLTAAGAKIAMVNQCRQNAKIQCDPEIALRPFRERLAKYEACISS